MLLYLNSVSYSLCSPSTNVLEFKTNVSFVACPNDSFQCLTSLNLILCIRLPAYAKIFPISLKHVFRFAISKTIRLYIFLDCDAVFTFPKTNSILRTVHTRARTHAVTSIFVDITMEMDHHCIFTCVPRKCCTTVLACLSFVSTMLSSAHNTD